MTTHEKQIAISDVKIIIQDCEGFINECEPNSDAFWLLIKARRNLISQLFKFNGYARHIEHGYVLRIASLTDNLHILFDGHTVAQPIGWYEPATEHEYIDYLTKQNVKI